MTDLPELSPKQAAFVEQYLIDRNGTQAAIRAGYSPNTATAQASRLLTNVNVAAHVQARQGSIAEQAGVRAVDVLRELRRVGFSDPRKLFDAAGNLRPIHDLDDDTAASIAGIDVETRMEGNGDDKEAVTVRKIKRHDKVRALEHLAKHLKLLVDRTEVTGKDGAPLKMIVLESGFGDGDQA
jgi:phage terminase small subunit